MTSIVKYWTVNPDSQTTLVLLVQYRSRAVAENLGMVRPSIFTQQGKRQLSENWASPFPGLTTNDNEAAKQLHAAKEHFLGSLGYTPLEIYMY